MRTIRRAPVAVVLILLLVAPVFAVTTAFWRLSTQAEFEKGKIDHVAITTDGALTLSPSYERVEGLETPYVWALAQDAKANLYAATGDKGIIYKISDGQKAAEFCKINERHALSLVCDKSGSLFAASAPNGRIYKVTPSGQVSLFSDTKETYVWALACSRDGNMLYAATGPHGRIFKISTDGKAEILLDSGQTHILCLALDKDDNLYAGTQPAGLVYKISPSGKAFVVYDAAEGDVHSLALDEKGNLYAATASAGELLAPPGGRPGGMIVAEIAVGMPPSMGDASAQAERRPDLVRAAPRIPEMAPPSPPPPTITAKNSIYKIAPDGRVTPALTLDKAMILSLAVVGKDLWAGTGNEARLYRVPLADPSKYELIMDPDELQVISLLSIGNGALAIATGNLGHVFVLEDSFAKRGTFLSHVFDTSSISQWGAISWEGPAPFGTGVAVVTRTGNSSKYDKTWSDWSPEITTSGKERIKSPPARFIQFRATLSSSSPEKSPRIREVAVPYLMLNMPPVISKLTLDGATGETAEAEKAPAAPAGSTADKLTKMGIKTTTTTTTTTTTKAAAPAPGAIPVHKAERAITWDAKDPDGDKLKYSLFYRAADEKEWKLLKDDLTATTHTWDTETVPDGEYLVRLVATDAPSNPPDRALRDEKVSEPLLIDNTRPLIHDLKAESADKGKWKIRGAAGDELSTILEIQYSVDAKDWVSIYPTSGIFDSKTAEFEFTLQGLPAGEHTVSLKATDAAGNRGLAKVVFR